MPKVLICRPFLPIVTELLSPHCEIVQWNEVGMSRSDLLENVEGIDALVCAPSEKVNSELLQKAGENLKVVATHSVGMDHVDVAECKKRGIKIGYTPDVLSNAVAEMAVGLLLSASRCFKAGFRGVDCENWGSWKRGLNMAGHEINGGVIGFFGLGRIGLEAAKILKAFRPAKILYHNRSVNEKAKEVDAIYVDFDTLLKESDFVIATCSVNEGNRGIFNEKAFNKMKTSSVFVNTSRGELVNQDDLARALMNGDIWAAGLDVTTPEPLPKDHPLVVMENCVITPHLGSATFKARYAMAELTARNALAGLNGDALPSPFI